MRPAALLLLLTFPFLTSCAPSATFVSAEPPHDVEVSASFTSGAPAVTNALRLALGRSGITPDPVDAAENRVIGVRQQVPYVGAGASNPAPGQLPVYTVTAVVTPGERTHVRLSVIVQCPACDGSTPYEWEYPVDVVRNVLERTRRMLGERGTTVDYPPRHRPTAWRPLRQ